MHKMCLMVVVWLLLVCFWKNCAHKPTLQWSASTDTMLCLIACDFSVHLSFHSTEETKNSQVYPALPELNKLPSNILEFLLGDPEAFPSQMRYVISSLFWVNLRVWRTSKGRYLGAQHALHHDRPIQQPHYHWRHTNLSFHLMLHFTIPHNPKT